MQKEKKETGGSDKKKALEYMQKALDALELASACVDGDLDKLLISTDRRNVKSTMRLIK